ncbi:hypothetical protein H311_02483 [Anncaliia algerae PRA109]|nr:hypothetical protein H311_02483 [Anncaliia algerae PRA109]
MLLYFILCLCSHKHKHSKKCKSREVFIEKLGDNKYNVGNKIIKVVKPKEVKSKRSKVESDTSLTDSDEYDSMPESLKNELLDTDISSSESDTKSKGKTIAKHKEKSKAKKKSKSAKKSSKVGGIKSDSDSKQKSKKSSKKVSKVSSSNSESSESSSASVHKSIKGRKQLDKFKASKYKSKSSESETDSKSSVDSSSDSDESDKRRRSNAKKGTPSTNSSKGNVEVYKKKNKFILLSKDNKHAIDLSEYAKETGEIDFKAVLEVLSKNFSMHVGGIIQNICNKRRIKKEISEIKQILYILNIIVDNKEKVDDIIMCLLLINVAKIPSLFHRTHLTTN